MTDSFPADSCRLGTRDKRALSIARRLLAGAGRAEFVAYRLEGQPTLDLLVHGCSSAGDLVIAANLGADDASDELGATTAVDIRLDLALESREVDVRVIAATAHLLGTLEWRRLDDDGASLDGAMLPGRIAELAQLAGWRLGVVEAAGMILHDGAGASSFGIAEVLGSSGGLEAELLGPEVEAVADRLAAEFTQSDLAWAVEAVRGGWLPGTVLSTRPPAPACSGLHDRVFWVDVDRTTITLMRTGTHDTVVVALPIPPGASGGDSLYGRALLALGAPELDGAPIAPRD